MNITMKDRVAVVTGGSKGIGIAVARRLAKIRRQGRDPCAEPGGFEGGAPTAGQGWPRGSRLRVRRLKGRGHRQHLREGDRRFRPDRHARRQCRNIARDALLDGHRRNLAGRPRSETVRGDPVQPIGLAWHEGAQMGAHHQRAQCRRQGTAGCIDADVGLTRRRHGLDKGDGKRRWPAQDILVDAMLVGLVAGINGSSVTLQKRRRRISPPSRTNSPRACRSAAWERRRNSPTSPAFSHPSRARTSPAPPSMSMEGGHRWCRGFCARRPDDVLITSPCLQGKGEIRVSEFRVREILRKRGLCERAPHPNPPGKLLVPSPPNGARELQIRPRP